MTDDNETDEQLKKLRDDESRGNRLDRDNPQNQPDLVDAIEQALDAADDGNITETVTAYDPRMAALLVALDDQDEIEDVFESLSAAYNGDSGIEKPTRSAIIRLAIRVGLQEGGDGVLDDLREALARQEPTV